MKKSDIIIFNKSKSDVLIVTVLAKCSPIVMLLIIIISMTLGNPGIFGMIIMISLFSFILFVFYSHFLTCARRIEISKSNRSILVTYFLSSKNYYYSFSDIEKIDFTTDTAIILKNRKKIIWKGGASEELFTTTLKDIVKSNES